ncbi:MAG: hypothetical protein ACYSU0_02195 [Planctomycetota bacterium]|jgi:hypothetical protein
MPHGIAGYGFRAEGMTFIVLMNTGYSARRGPVSVRLPPGKYDVCDLYTGRRVAAKPDPGGLILRPGIPPNGACLLVLRRADDRPR